MEVLEIDRFISSVGLCGCGGLMVGFVQTRMQILHPSNGGLYTGLTNAVSTIYRIEGWRTLWKGVSSVIVGAGECDNFGRAVVGAIAAEVDLVNF